MPIDTTRLCECHGEPMTMRPSNGRFRCHVNQKITQAKYQASNKGKAVHARSDAAWHVTPYGRTVANEKSLRGDDNRIIARVEAIPVSERLRSDRLLLAGRRARRGAVADADNEAILYLDVERMKATIKGYVDNRPQWIRDTDILAAEWIFAVGMAWDHVPDEFLFIRGGYEVEDHERMLRATAEEMRHATTIVTYNGTNADIKWLQAEFAQYRIDAPTRDLYRHLDLFRVVGRELGLSRKSLRYAARMLLNQDKGDIEIEEAGEKALNGDENAWKEVREYNQIDVQLLVELRELLVQQGHIY